MALTPSTFQLSIGSTAPDFELPDPDGQMHSLKDISAGANATVVVFACNHCPYVVHIKDALGQLADEYKEKGVAFVAINSNDVENYPDDKPEKMKDFAAQAGWNFPYLFDESQEVAKAYQAACTPDLFAFDQDLKLQYAGQFDSTRPSTGGTADGADLAEALDAIVDGQDAPQGIPSTGCNIKWKPGNAPDWFR